MDIPGSVHHILQGKTDPIWTTTPDSLVFDAVRLMGDKDVGALVVADEDKVVGLISERDYSRKIALMGKSSRDTRVGEVMRQPVVTIKPDTSISECMQLMTDKRIRHLPVVEDGRLTGIVSIGDLVNWVMRYQRDTIQHLEGYISGQYPA